MGLSYEEFKKLAAELTGVDLSAYKSQQMDRRLHSLMHAWGLNDYDSFLAALRSDGARFREFQKKLTINVSEFFRNPERFQELAAEILPGLFSSGRRLRCWSAGCANGAEPYSLAILLAEAGYGPGAAILGTDIDRESLHRAHLGIYAANEVRSVPPHLRDKYFRLEERGYRLSEDIKSMVEFRCENLLREHGNGEYDLILCRNVVIYLTEQAKTELYRRLCQKLRPGGYLMVGGTEPLLNFKDYGLENPLSAFYRKPAADGVRPGIRYG